MLLYGIRFQALEVRWDWLQSCSPGTSTVGAPEARLPPGHLLSVHVPGGDWLLVFLGSTIQHASVHPPLTAATNTVILLDTAFKC